MQIPKTRVTRFAATLAAGVLFVPLAPGQEVGPTDYVAAWSLDEGVGSTVADSSPNAFGGFVRGPQWTSGVSGVALEFGGASELVELTDGNGAPDLLGTLDVGTISIWFRFDTPPPSNQVHPIFYLGDGLGGDSNSSVIIELGHFTGDSKLYFTVYDPAGIPQCFDTDFNLDTGRWYHFAAVVGTGFNTGYLDGVELTDRDYNFGGPTDDYFLGDIANPRLCWLGKGYLGSITAEQYHDGAIDEVRIYDRPLDAAEIAQYYADVIAGGAPSFCDATDGSLAACPCANPGNPDTGCDLQQGTGGVRLDVAAQEVVPMNRVTVTGTGFPVASSPGTVILRATGLDPAAPVLFGDGLRCVGTPVVRLGAAFASGGTSSHTFGHGTMAGAGTFYYQLWFRNTPAMYCTPDAFNLSNGRTLIW